MGQKQLINFLGLTWSSGPRNLMETPRNPLSVSAYHCAAFPINSLGPQKPSTCPLALSVQLHILIKTCLFVIPLRRQLWMHRGKNLRMPVSDGTVRHCPPHENIDQLANYANIFFLGGYYVSFPVRLRIYFSVEIFFEATLWTFRMKKHGCFWECICTPWLFPTPGATCAFHETDLQWSWSLIIPPNRNLGANEPSHWPPKKPFPTPNDRALASPTSNGCLDDDCEISGGPNCTKDTTLQANFFELLLLGWPWSNRIPGLWCVGLGLSLGL